MPPLQPAPPQRGNAGTQGAGTQKNSSSSGSLNSHIGNQNQHQGQAGREGNVSLSNTQSTNNAPTATHGQGQHQHLIMQQQSPSTSGVNVNLNAALAAAFLGGTGTKRNPSTVHPSQSGTARSQSIGTFATAAPSAANTLKSSNHLSLSSHNLPHASNRGASGTMPTSNSAPPIRAPGSLSVGPPNSSQSKGQQQQQHPSVPGAPLPMIFNRGTLVGSSSFQNQNQRQTQNTTMQSHGHPSAPSSHSNMNNVRSVPSNSGAPPKPQPSQQASSGPVLRELKVEDALMYLDQVKMEFGDKPRIYNEFLEIMKNFKSQEIDTPGVIAGVSSLFRGYDNLILGFNTFLPDGYKIELKDLMPGGVIAEQNKLLMQNNNEGPGPSGGPIGVSQQGGVRGPNQINPPYYQGKIGAQQPSVLGRQQPAQPVNFRSNAAPNQGNSLAKSGHHPHHPTQQQGPATGTRPNPSVPSARGRPYQSLPTKINRIPVLSHGPPSQQPAQKQAHASGQQHITNLQQPPPRQYQQQLPSSNINAQQSQSNAIDGISQQGQHVPPHSNSGSLTSQQQQQPLSQQQQPPSQQLQQPHAVQQQQPPPPQHQQAQTQQGGMQHAAVEFDHAITYVTTIKKRFASEPHTYQAFLEILHTYQKEQRGIKEVLEQVSSLFADHPDLLKQFTFFLPDAVQEQAKKELHQVASENEARLAAEAAQKQQQLNAANQAQQGYEQQHTGNGITAKPFQVGNQANRQSSTASGFHHQQHQQDTFAQRTQPNSVGSQHNDKKPRLNSLPGAGRGIPINNTGTSHMKPSFYPSAQPPQLRPGLNSKGPNLKLPQHGINPAGLRIAGTGGPSTIDQSMSKVKQPTGSNAPVQINSMVTSFRPVGKVEHQHDAPDSSQVLSSVQGKKSLVSVPAPTQPNSKSVSVAGSQYQVQRKQEQQTMTCASGGGPSTVDTSENNQTTQASIIPIHPPQPETFVYNSAVERQFFDSAKEALTSFSRDGGAAWAEFLKSIDMFCKELVSRSELLQLVEDLLGKRNTDLFEEFKRILAGAGGPNTPTHDDEWYSIPLSEIDFSRCRKCSPSYRALPRDYPVPPCSGRISTVDKKALNDVWVSLPVGSEESYTFRHMRKNQYEEVLFRCEDERFEIDMIVDTNAATLRRLEKINVEIALLAQKELSTPSNHFSSTSRIDKDSGKNKLDNDDYKGGKKICDGGLAGKRFQYSLDKSILGIIHIHTIARIYGDAGPDIIELLFKNPTMAIPIVVKRLRQKDKEWRAARDVLNQRWKELAEVNYHRSLDHRSLTWRTVDKRATSTRTLVAEIKDRAAHNGNEGEAALTARRDKAKDEHGSFYDITMGQSLSRKMDLTSLPKPSKAIFTPHLSLMYENNSCVQRDAYRILAFALERGSISPGDKERGHRLWRDFLGPWFGLSMSWMQKPATQFVASSSFQTTFSNSDASERDEDSDMDDPMDEGKEDFDSVKRTSDSREEEETFIIENQPVPVGARVSTLFGLATVLGFRRDDRIYIVSLPFGAQAYLHPNAILCTILPPEKSEITSELRASDDEELTSGDMLAIGTQSSYLFFRLHQVFVKRLNTAKKLAFKVSNDSTVNTLVETVTLDPIDGRSVGQKRYDAYLALLYPLVEMGYNNTANAAVEGGRYEDRVRSLLGHGAYELATMDKLISHILKNLQNMGNDETFQELIELHRRHKESGRFKPTAFRQEAAQLSEGENLFAFQHCKVPNTDNSIVHFEYLGCIAESDNTEDPPEVDVRPKRVNSDVVMKDTEDTDGGHSLKRQRR